MDLDRAPMHIHAESLAEGSREEDRLMKSIGYARVESGGNIAEQKERLQSQGGCSEVYSEKHRGVARKARKQSFGHAIRSLNAGDRFVIDRRERIGRDDRDADVLLAGLLIRGVHIVVLDEDVDTQNDDGAFGKDLVAKLAEAGISDDDIEAAMKDAEKEGEKTLRSKIRDADLPDIARMVEDGVLTEDIAARYNANDTAVRRAYRRLGLPKRRRRDAGKSRARPEFDTQAARS
ncbi:hypothetical protein GFM44_23450 [Rhizobium leguminosarum bv. viciae]|nr:hypothetical protein [Rhizobium leguminosarum bv. viciae]